ncbi:hypothetical protein [Microcoleus sp. bin38.metabat.b11b12b14.051]|uniref:hypothetical protein n=1 Tax=Microcoleus sp. bin38.metabat.b11b12b14.051 TaxID=2742709 RepID=UPI0025DC82F5|nr:hypothetical protein [Microcoleus sp. bin38.metabat.b11b12b14.051]
MKDADAIFVTCPVAKGTGSLMLKISKNYTPLLADLGFTAVADPAAANAKLVKVGDALKTGDITRIRIQVKGTATKPPKGISIYCSTKEVAKAMSGLARKQWGNLTITNVGSIRRLRYR